MPFNWSLAEDNLFTSRFGSMGVAEIKQVLFAVYMSGADQTLTPYEIGRRLGLTESKVKSLSVGANLLLESDAQTEARARRIFKEAIERGDSLLVFNSVAGTVSVQISDRVALDYLSNRLIKASVFRDVDVKSDHIAVPVRQLQQLIDILAPGADMAAIEHGLLAQAPDFAEFSKTHAGSFFERVQKWLPQAIDAAGAAAALGQLIMPLLGGC